MMPIKANQVSLTCCFAVARRTRFASPKGYQQQHHHQQQQWCRFDSCSPYSCHSMLAASSGASAERQRRPRLSTAARYLYSPLTERSSSLSRPSSSRLFGSKPGSGIPGKVLISNEQDALPDIDLDRLQSTVEAIRRLIGETQGNDNHNYETYDVSLFLIDDEEMQQTNVESRGVDAPTDILSFPFAPSIRPGVLQPPDFDIPDYYNLGDMLIDVPYVIRSCRADQATTKDGTRPNDDDDDDDEDNEYDFVDDRGVSGAMAKVYDPEQRLHMLLVHGMLHLVGYDHEDEDETDYELMVTKEEEILKTLGMM